MAQIYAKKTSDGKPKALECTDEGLLKVDTELTATIDPTGLATQTTLAAVLAKLSADPATQTTLAALLAKVIAAPATEAKQPALEGTDKAKVSLYVKKSANGDSVLTLGKTADADSLPVTLSTETIAALVGLLTSSPASITSDEDGTARNPIELWKAIKNMQIDENASLAVIENETHLRDIGSPVRITHNSTSQSVAVPATAKAFVCMAEGGVNRCEIGGAASASSAIYVAEEASLVYPITGGIQTLFCYGVSGAFGNFRFLG